MFFFLLQISDRCVALFWSPFVRFRFVCVSVSSSSYYYYYCYNFLSLSKTIVIVTFFLTTHYSLLFCFKFHTAKFSALDYSNLSHTISIVFNCLFLFTTLYILRSLQIQFVHWIFSTHLSTNTTLLNMFAIISELFCDKFVLMKCCSLWFEIKNSTRN